MPSTTCLPKCHLLLCQKIKMLKRKKGGEIRLGGQREGERRERVRWAEAKPLEQEELCLP